MGLALLLTVGWASAAPAGGVAQRSEGLAVIAHPSSGVRRLSAAELEAIFTSSKRSWDNGRSIVAFNLATQSPLRHAFDRAVLDLDPDDVGRFWINKRIRGGARPPRQVGDARLMSRVIARLPGSIGYVPEGSIPRGVRVVARIRGGRVLAP